MDHRIIVGSLVLGLAVIITTPAIGQVLDANGHPLCPTGHPGAIVDVQTGRLWLDVTETLGRSFSDITTKLGVAQEFSGWRVATETDIRQLFTNFGLPLTDSWQTNTEASEGVIEFVSIYGGAQPPYGGWDAEVNVYSSGTFSSYWRMQSAAAQSSQVYIGNNGFNSGFATSTVGNTRAGTALVRDNVSIARTVVGQDLTVFGANHLSMGDYGTSTQRMDPLFDVDNPFAGSFRTGGGETFGNNVETQNGWESTQLWEPYQLADGSWKAGKGFGVGTILKGQYSRIGTKPGNFALFGVGFVNDAEWRTRDLETYSSGSVALQDMGTAPTEVEVRLDYDAQINGSALEKCSAVAINLIPTIVSAVATAGGELLEEKLLDGLVKSQAQKWAGIQMQLVTEKSDFSGLADMQLQLLQDGQIVDTISVSSPEFRLDSVEARYGGYVLKTSRRVGGRTTVSVDPTKPLDYCLDISTHAGALGTGQAYMGVPYYKLEFSTPNQWSIPLVVERRDPAGNVGSPQALLHGTIGTPELIDGDVQLVDAIGPYAAQAGEKLVTFTNAIPSGLTMPVSLVDGDDSLHVMIASLVSGQENLDKIGVQIGYTTGDEFHSLFDDTLANLFAYEAISGLANMPYASQFVELDLDISGLSRGDQMLLFAFGDLDASGLESALVMDSFTVVPEPASLALLGIGVLALLRHRHPA